MRKRTANEPSPGASRLPSPGGRGFIAAIFGIVIFLIVRRALLVLFLSGKILGYGGALNAWEGPVARQTVIHDGIPIDIYRGPNSTSPILIIHGVNPTGKNSLDLAHEVSPHA